VGGVIASVIPNEVPYAAARSLLSYGNDENLTDNRRWNATVGPGTSLAYFVPQEAIT